MIVSPSLDTKYSVLIFKAGRVPINHGALGIARSLGGLGINVYAIVEDAYTPLAMSRYVRKSFIWRSCPNGSKAFVEALSKIAQSIGSPTILVPMDDLSAIYVAENAAELTRWFLFPQLPRDLPRQLADKASLQTLCARLGVPHARSTSPRTTDELREFIEHASFPIVLKAAQQWALSNEAHYNTKIIENRQTLFETFQRGKSDERTLMLIQEYIPGEDWIYHGYCNAVSELYVSFTGKKLLGYPAHGGGITALGVSMWNEELCSQAENLLRAVAYSGICDTDWRRDSRDGQFKLVDCNPRIGLNFQMFEDASGVDVVRALHLDLTRRQVKRTPMIANRLFIAEPFYLLSLIRGGRRTPLANNAAIRQRKLTRKLAWWSVKDPIPSLTMAMRIVFGALMRRLARVVRHPVRRDVDA